MPEKYTKPVKWPFAKYVVFDAPRYILIFFLVSTFVLIFFCFFFVKNRKKIIIFCL